MVPPDFAMRFPARCLGRDAKRVLCCVNEVEMPTKRLVITDDLSLRFRRWWRQNSEATSREAAQEFDLTVHQAESLFRKLNLTKQPRRSILKRLEWCKSDESVSAGTKIPHWKRPNGSVAPE
jgi:hypothetical protein